MLLKFARTLTGNGLLAQLAEQLAFNQFVPGSSPGRPTKLMTYGESIILVVSKLAVFLVANPSMSA